MKTETLYDKTTWPKGPWQNEPDKATWLDEHTGLACMIVRNQSGNLCGYVGVPEGHPAFEKFYEDVDVSIHGGLTYASFCQTNGHICHVPEPGQPDHVWWLGFDTAHFDDLTPIYAKEIRVYRDWHYVVEQIKSLAIQLNT